MPSSTASDIKIDFHVTDSRVAFRCEKYDKGSKWAGGLTASVLNIGSRILEANRRRGKIPPASDPKKNLSIISFPNYYKAPFGEDKRPVQM